ncbi:MAG: transcriptional repressor [Desulfuromonas sp.]|nr:MAG: transcriptional repressor [Desulfuromonas sp.]
MTDSKKKIFRDYLQSQRLKSTSQRELILDEFLASGEHPSTEDLYLRVRKKNPSVGYATVHRTLKLFAECGIASVQNFGDGTTRYESISEEEHHDHLVCKSCGLIIEFEDDRIEQLQDKVASQHNFKVVDHRLELYGLCEKCQ